MNRPTESKTAMGRVVQAAASLRPGARDRSEVRQLKEDLIHVYDTAQLLTGPMELQHVLEIVVKTVADALDVDAAGLRLLDKESDELVLKATYGLSEAYRNKGPVTAGESSINRRVLAGEDIVVNNMSGDNHFQRYRKEIEREELVSSLSIPLVYREEGLGILRLYSKRARRFSPADISLARTVAAQSAAAIVNVRLYREALEGERMARQLRLAGAVQRHLIPQDSPKVPGFDVAGLYVPCHQVGGDFYDLVAFADGRFMMALGDVMGKGAPASLAMVSVRSSLRAFAEYIDDVAKLVARVNGMFTRDTAVGEFATVFCGILTADHSTLNYCNCGHEPPILLRKDEVIDLSGGGTVLGLDSASQFDAQQIALQKDDMIVMYTDGLADAVNFERESFGRARIVQAVLASQDMSAEEAAKNILWLMRKFTGLTERFDDTALVVIKKNDAVV